MLSEEDIKNLLIYPNKKSDGVTINTDRTVFQTQLDKSPLREFPNITADADTKQKDYIISDCLNKGNGGIFLFAGDNKITPFNTPGSLPKTIPVWQKNDGILHPFDHALVTNFPNPDSQMDPSIKRELGLKPDENVPSVADRINRLVKGGARKNKKGSKKTRKQKKSKTKNRSNGSSSRSVKRKKTRRN